LTEVSEIEIPLDSQREKLLIESLNFSPPTEFSPLTKRLSLNSEDRGKSFKIPQMGVLDEIFEEVESISEMTGRID
jgi:hypothetical protein